MLIESSKSNRIEIYQITADGIILQHAKTIYGTISLLTKLRPPDSATDLLFVGTDSYAYFTLSWDPETKQLRTVKSYVDLADKLARPSQSVDRCVVDPSGRLLILELFEGTLTIIPLYSKEKGRAGKEEWQLCDPIPMRISERFIRSLCFLQNRETKLSKQSRRPRLAILYDDGSGDCRRVTHTLDYTPGSNDVGSADFDKKSEVKDTKNDVENSSSHVLPVAKPLHGSLVLSEASISYWTDSGEKGPSLALSEATVWSAWTEIDTERWLLADEYGKLYFLGLVAEIEGFEQGGVKALRLDLLGKISCASVLIYLDAGYFYVGSKRGDSQVVRIGEDGNIEVVQTLASIAPITDFAIMDMGSRSGEGQVNEYSSGQARIVTGSGAFQDGSLRSVRSGVGIEDLGSLGELEHVTDLFSLRGELGLKNNVILASFVNETRIFQFIESGEVEETQDFHGFTLDDATILAQNLSKNRLLQVTGREAKIVDLESGMISETYNAKQGSIVAASVNANYLLISIDGSQLLTLDLHQSLNVVAGKTFEQGTQVSCLDLPNRAPEIAVIGYWQGAAIDILDVSTLEVIHHHKLDGNDSLVPRSLILAQLLREQHPTLLVAMADGTIITLELNLKTFDLINQKSTILGTQQANLKILAREDGLDQVFAACEHPSLIYGSEGRYVYSAVTASKVSCVCSFDSEAYPGSIALASSEDVKIALIDNERTTHVQTLHVGETVRRIAYSPMLKVFGLGCISRTLEDGVEFIKSSFKLADEVVLQELDSYELKREEIIESVIRAQLKSSTGSLEERFVVGTAYIEDGTEESIRGRILVFEVSRDRQLILLAEQNVRSACRALAEVQGKIAAALMKTVSLLLLVIEPTLIGTACNLLSRIQCVPKSGDDSNSYSTYRYSSEWKYNCNW